MGETAAVASLLGRLRYLLSTVDEEVNEEASCSDWTQNGADNEA
eukprot:CAMPEP_0185615184 /NCGR_PEP_ID=MMETSP0436-20130131/34848_1 /TAXON_ID=626734 ORGANISM="Favella taraikaensis, Strain Fe Narragansett Bay" /NCGR_SAMPLE_ID=MMETSP0436 /ASSEMBLY_ACC=CAM_ASM_000390 /LENGTH=43 /DNA_ID= /DNA_START= /DNA_END= /DNA_ORIENTATION=